MSTIIYSSCYLDGVDKSGSSRLIRTIFWAHYYSALRQELGIDQLVLIDNGSSPKSLADLISACAKTGLIVQKKPNLKGNHNALDYPYCWRAIHYMGTMIRMPDHQLDKIIFIDTDCYVLTRRLAHFIRDLNHDWVSFQSEIYHWPLSEFHVLSRAHFSRFLEFVDGKEEDFIRRNNGKYMERQLPFSLVMTNPYKCDRYGEKRMMQTDKMDFYAQRPQDIAIRYSIAGL